MLSVEALSRAAALVWLRDQPWPVRETSTDAKREAIVTGLLRMRGLVERGIFSDHIPDLAAVIAGGLAIPAAHPKGKDDE